MLCCTKYENVSFFMKFPIKHQCALIFFLIFWILCHKNAFGQEISEINNLKKATIFLTERLDTIPFSSFSVVPQSDKLSQSMDYSIDYVHGIFYELTNSKSIDTIELTYRSLYFNLENSENQLKQYIDPGYDTTAYEIFIINQAESSTFDFDNLKVEGNVGRGLNFGNNQNLVVNSNLNLRISGVVAEDVEVVGVLTDRNLPFQPQGDSRQLKELDQVFLQFRKNPHQITLGDFEYRKPESYFLNLDKRLKGLNYQGKFKAREWQIATQTNAALSRGKYNQLNFIGIEGNQGPYKLFGAENQSNIIILAGTERVFIDGILLQRGRDRDYIIDYNSGEITFTSRQLITNRSRIAVEYEYQNQNYTNSLLHNETTFKKDKLAMRFNIYSQQDSKKRINLGDTTLNTGGLFSQLGDSDQEFFVSSAQKQTFDANRVQYRLVTDSIIQGQSYDSIYVYSRNAQDELYRVDFTFVGEGNGDYSLSNNVVNGRIYEWQPPLNDQPQGSYVAQLRLIPPGQQQYFSLATEYALNPHNLITFEAGLSNKDINTLSTIGNDDNHGLSGHFSWKNKTYLSRKDSTKHLLNITLNYERKGANFRAIERYRPVEFSRNWNLANAKNDSLGEHFGVLSMTYGLNPNTTVLYQASYFGQDEEYKGFKQLVGLQGRRNNFEYYAKLDYLSAQDNQSIKSTFLRPSFQISQAFKSLNGFKIGVVGEDNKREFQNKITNQLSAASIQDQELKFFIELPDTTKVPLRLSIGRHNDFSPNGTSLDQVFAADELNFSGKLLGIPRHQLNWTMTYRSLKVTNSDLTTENSRNSVLGKINYSGKLFKGLINTGFDYEVSTGREPRREFSFVQVADGEGNFIWNDYNNNGIQEINEFEASPFQDEANFIRVYTNSNEYINVNSGQFNPRVTIDFAKIWNPRSSKGFKNFAARFQLNSNLLLNNKLFDNNNSSEFFPFVESLSNEALISSNNQLSNRLFYNKLSNKFRLNWVNRIANSKSLLLSGFEERVNEGNEVTMDFFFKKKIGLTINSSYGNQAYFSENYSAKNFDYNRLTLQPKINWIVQNDLRFSVDYLYSQAKNDSSYGGQNTNNNAANVEFNWNKKNKFSLKGGLNFTNVDFSGQANDAVAFSMLNGLQNGRNILWNLNFEREVFKALTINLIYNGRQLGENNIINTGQARFTATF